jgi:formiminotetrahydrofolate cyclodeaminase
MKKYKTHTLKEYADVLSRKTPVPGGGSAAAYAGVLGVSLIAMVAHYSRGKGKTKAVEKKIGSILKKCKAIQKQMLDLVDLDAQAYLKVVKSKDKSAKEKKAALKGASKVPLELCKLCYKAMEMTPYLVKNGNKYLVSDIEVAIEMLLAAFNSSVINININK